MNSPWLWQSSSLEAIKVGTKEDERRYFALHPNTGKTLVSSRINNFKNFISNKIVEIENDGR